MLVGISQKLYCPFYMGELEFANFLFTLCFLLMPAMGQVNSLPPNTRLLSFQRVWIFYLWFPTPCYVTFLRRYADSIDDTYYVMHIRLSFDWKIFSKLFFSCVDERIMVSKSMITPYFCDQGILGNLPKFNLRWYNCSIIWWKFLRSCNLN